MEQHKDLEIPWKEIPSNTFHSENYLGGGGFGKVYKGELSRFKERGTVAFKKLDREYGQGETEFFKEIEMLSQYKHENIITLLGYCMEGKELILVYEYASNRSLDRCLNSPNLTWTLRLKICLQAAKGLRYLHDSNKSRLPVIHRDIKSANILLDDKWNAKISDFGLSKISPVNAYFVTYATGTSGYSDPQYYKTYTLTEKSDIYSFGVTLFEVLCGRLCYDVIGHNELLVFVPKWMGCYEQNKLKEIVFKGLDMTQMDQSSLNLFSDISYKCLNESREKRPTMAEVVTELEVALQNQEEYDMIRKHPVAKKYIEIARAAVSPFSYRSIEELKERLSEGFLINGGKTWFSINDKEHCIMLSIEDCLIQDDSGAEFSSEKNSRFVAGCYKAHIMSFKIRVKTPCFLSPHVIYRVNLVFQYSKIEQMKQQSIPVKYKLLGETKISMVNVADTREDGWLGTVLCHFTNEDNTSIRDLEIIFDDCGFRGYFIIEGIEFQPLRKRMEHPVEVVEYEEILNDTITPLSYRSKEELKQLLTRGILLNWGGTLFCLNEKGQHIERIFIESCLDVVTEISTYPDWLNSRFPGGRCYRYEYSFKARVRGEYLTPQIPYTLNLVFRYKDQSQVNSYDPLRYKIHGQDEKRVFIIYPYIHEREDGWFIVPLYHFTSQHTTVHFKFQFEYRDTTLQVAGFEFQPSQDKVELPVFEEYQHIVEASSQPLVYRSLQELKQILSKGIHLNGYKEWFSLDEKGQHIERIFIQSCLDDVTKKRTYRNWLISSRFPGGSCYEYNKWDFKARVRGEYLTPQIPYTLNLVFRYRWQDYVNKYNPLRYKIDGEDETKVFIIYPCIHEIEDGWFIVPLYHFTSQHTIADLQFQFEYRDTTLLVEGFEFRPSEDKVELPVFEEYQHILEASSQPLVYRSLQELKQILSKGIHLNGYKEWFSLDEKGQHCHMISMEDCLIPNEYFPPQYNSENKSRFPAGIYLPKMKGFKTHVKTQLLNPLIPYIVNLVFYHNVYGYEGYIDLKYRINGGTLTYTRLLVKITRDYLQMVELYQVTSNGGVVDLEIDFAFPGIGIEMCIKGLEGILFQPLEKVEDQVFREDKLEDIQPILELDSNAYWGQELPNKSEEILKLSKHTVEEKTMKGTFFDRIFQKFRHMLTHKKKNNRVEH